MSVVTVVAPAGYGKTTLLAQWAERDSRPFVWVTADDRDNDVQVFLRHVAAGIDGRQPLDARTLAALRSPDSSLFASAVPRLARALAACGPVVLVLDDFGAVRSRASLEAVAALIRGQPEGSMLVTAGRMPARLPVAHLRASGRLLEVGADELAMTNREARLLLRATGVPLEEALVGDLVRQCEGWPAALYLAALAIRDGKQAGRAVRFGGDDRYMADYFRSECLSHLSPGQLRFLRRTSVLDRMCGPLCDAVLQDGASPHELEKMERRNLFLVPLDNRREWYRYRRLFRELMQHELARHEPKVVPSLHRRAVDWLQANGDDESALGHAYAAGDTDRAATILAAIAFPLYDSGRVASLEHWLERFEEAGLLERYPPVALHGCRVHLHRGRAEQAERWLSAAKGAAPSQALPDGSPSVLPWIAVLRAWMCHAGPRQMLADAESAAVALPHTSCWRASALVAQGVALILLGEDERADAALAAAAEAAGAGDSRETQVVALAERALLAAERGAHDTAERLSTEAMHLVTSGVEDVPARVLEHAVAARLLLRRGRWNEARTRLTSARSLLPQATVAIPWLSAQARVELARGWIALRDRACADELMREVDEIVWRVPDLGVLRVRAADVQSQAETVPERSGVGSAGLTAAELRLLPLLATHLSFREIAEQLYVSRNTVKTQAISVYRKLGVSSRSEAIAEAQRLGLGEHLQVVVSNNR